MTTTRVSPPEVAIRCLGDPDERLRLFAVKF